MELRPELERFIDDQVKAGRFASRTQALEAGVARLMLDGEDELDPLDVQDIRESLEQMTRGEVVDWRQFATGMRQKYSGK